MTNRTYTEQDRSDAMDIVHARANQRQVEALARYKRRLTREIKERLSHDLLHTLSSGDSPIFGPNELSPLRKALQKL